MDPKPATSIESREGKAEEHRRLPRLFRLDELILNPNAIEPQTDHGGSQVHSRTEFLWGRCDLRREGGKNVSSSTPIGKPSAELSGSKYVGRLNMVGDQESPVHVILGATGGVGSALARRLASNGARLVLGGRSAEKLSRLTESTGGETCLVDGTRYEEVNGCITRAMERFGRVDGVVNCIGSLLLKPAHLTTEADWEATLSVNLTSAFYTVKAAVGAMMKNRRFHRSGLVSGSAGGSTQS